MMRRYYHPYPPRPVLRIPGTALRICYARAGTSASGGRGSETSPTNAPGPPPSPRDPRSRPLSAYMPKLYGNEV
eukprot:2398115-Rhodomonas_salina.3